MLVKKWSKFQANFTQLDKMSKLQCIDQFRVLILYLHIQKKKKFLGCLLLKSWKCYISTNEPYIMVAAKLSWEKWVCLGNIEEHMCVNCPTVKQVRNALKVSESSACRIKVY